MTERVLDIALRADGLLATFAEAGVLGLADVNTAVRLARLAGEEDDTVRLALALAVRALRNGSVCLELATAHELPALDETGEPVDLPWPEPTAWLAAVAASPLVGVGADAAARPLRLNGTALYLERYWRQERFVAADLRRRRAGRPRVDAERLASALDLLFDGAGLAPGEPDLQRAAAEAAAAHWVSVVAGGPGTGKTTTVARLLAVLDRLEPGLRVALAAPTGKAAARLEEAVRASLASVRAQVPLGLPDLTASTIHRLLGWRSGGRFVHDADNPLPHDVVVIDETSMISLTLMARLLSAVRPDARLILVGDPYQLASVEAGAVMADVTDATGLAEVTELTHAWRFGAGGQIDELARAIRGGDAARATSVATSGGAVSLSPATGHDTAQLRALQRRVVTAGTRLFAAAARGDVPAALAALDEHRLLCGHVSGLYGATRWARLVESWLRQELPGFGREGEWYVGRPLLVTANTPDLGLFNGDTGVVVATPDGVRAAFARGGDPVVLSPAQLDDVDTMFAMTVHKAQGSQFEQVSVVLPPAESPLLTRELLYTAVTRASDRVDLLGTPEQVALAIERPARRASGLAAQH